MSNYLNCQKASASLEMNKKSNSYKVKIAKDKCKSCNLCIIHCPTKHLKFSSKLNKRGVVFAITDSKTKCIGCGFCFFMCPDGCIEVFEIKNI